ncbi:MAG: VOC family protein [Lentisphaeria bacterium]|nr:VOC family protein [Lentisphaeria bacterium]NQZ70706.1 VOC family protein [Lentisphaeria bacterium]
MISHIDHINIVVKDLDRSVKFYTELLGFTLSNQAHLEGDWIETIVGLNGVNADVKYVRPESGPRIELIQYNLPEGSEFPDNSLANTRGLRHIAFLVDDMSVVLKRLEEAGVSPINPPVRVPANVITHKDGHKNLCYLEDPDGVILELTEYKND